jgi:hypothetical protein
MAAVMDAGQGTMRLLRGGLLAACCVLLGLSGHTLGGGSVPAAAPALVASALIGLAAVAWAGRRRDFRALLWAAALAQAAFHTALSLAPTHNQQHGLVLRMLAGHAAATVVMAAALARGEAVLEACARAAGYLGVPDPPVLISSRPVLRPRPVRRMVAAAGVLLATAHPRRGPPVAAAA